MKKRTRTVLLLTITLLVALGLGGLVDHAQAHEITPRKAKKIAWKKTWLDGVGSRKEYYNRLGWARKKKQRHNCVYHKNQSYRHCPKPVTRIVYNNAVASSYGRCCYGNRTADGTPFTSTTRSIAHRSLPFGTRIRVRSNGRTIIGVVKDRGPFVYGRTFDLSYQLVRDLGYHNEYDFGVRTIKYSIL